MTLNTEIIYNSIPGARKRHTTCVLIFCLVIYCGTIFLSTKIGYFVFKILEIVINDFSILFLNILQLIGVMYFYGIVKFRDDIHFMLGIRSSLYWNTLYILNPIFLVTVLVFNLHDFYSREKTVESYSLKTFRFILIWLSLGFMLFYCFFYIVVNTFNHNFKIFKSTSNWGPRHPSLLISRKMFKSYNVVREYLYRQERFRQEQIEEIEM